MAGRILVLDDEENYAAMLQDLLLENNYRVDMATKPERAIAQLEEIPYDLVISDYKMPVMDGADFLKRSRELYPNLPFILVSGLMNTPELVKVANMSVTLVMEKPLDTEVFLRHVARFSTPMTAEEKESIAAEGKPEAGGGTSAPSYPEEPKFFSALSTPAKRFLDKAWHACRAQGHLFVHQEAGGDGELASRDLSEWLGNRDKIVQPQSFADVESDLGGVIADLLSDEERSDLFCIRLDDPSELKEARALAASLPGDVPTAVVLFLLEATGAEDAFKAEAGPEGLFLPPLRERPSDIANYARRAARIAVGRREKAESVSFAWDAVFALLTASWPRNYRQLSEAITRLLAEEDRKELTASDFSREPGFEGVTALPEPKQRLAELLQHSQGVYLERLATLTGQSARAVAQTLGFESEPDSTEALRREPLVNPAAADLQTSR